MQPEPTTTVKADESESNATTESLIEKRARWEQMLLVPCRDGEHINVKNLSHGTDTKGHIYTVTVDTERDTPEHCTCKAFEFGGGKPCKHMLAVRNDDDILDELATFRVDHTDAEAEARAVADGGVASDEGVEILDSKPLGDSEIIVADERCPHDNPDCQGPGASDRPVLCFLCWRNKAQYDPPEHLLEANSTTEFDTSNGDR